MKPIIKTIMAAAFVAGLATSVSATPRGKALLETTIRKSPMTLTSGLITTSATAQQYTCPMHPEVVKDAAGNCPKCGMKLVEKTSGKTGGNDAGKGCGDGCGKH